MMMDYYLSEMRKAEANLKIANDKVRLLKSILEEAEKQTAILDKMKVDDSLCITSVESRIEALHLMISICRASFNLSYPDEKE